MGASNVIITIIITILSLAAEKRQRRKKVNPCCVPVLDHVHDINWWPYDGIIYVRANNWMDCHEKNPFYWGPAVNSVVDFVLYSAGHQLEWRFSYPFFFHFWNKIILLFWFAQFWSVCQMAGLWSCCSGGGHDQSVSFWPFSLTECDTFRARVEFETQWCSTVILWSIAVISW